MVNIYDVVLKRGHYQPIIGWQESPKCLNIIIFYDEDREKAVNEMRKYVSKNGFTTPDGKHTIWDIILVERRPTGEIITETSYHKIFDIYGKRKSAKEDSYKKGR